MRMLGIATPVSFKSLVAPLILAVLLGIWYYSVYCLEWGLPTLGPPIVLAFLPYSNVEIRPLSNISASIIHSGTKGITIGWVL